MAPPKSKLWVYFNKTGKDSVTCKTCLKTLKSSGNTTNMKKHLVKHKIYLESTNRNKFDEMVEHGKVPLNLADDLSHKDNTSVTSEISKPSTYAQQLNAGAVRSMSTVIAQPQPSISKAFQNITSYAHGGTQYANITSAIAYYICADNRPFRTVEGRGFRYLMKKLAPLYKVASRELIKRYIDDKYEFISTCFKNKLEFVEQLSVTCDVWTEMMSTRSFLGVTLHYIHEDFSLKSINVGVHELSERHTAEYIAESLKMILNEWRINLESVMAVITDNGSNMVSAVTQTFGRSKHVPCFAHTLNLITENSMKNELCCGVIEEVRTVVKWIKNSVIASDELRASQLSSGVSEGKLKKMILDVKTRWNSTYHMLERFLELSAVVSKILLTKPKAPAMPTAVGLLSIQELITILRPLEFMSREASAEKYIVISKIIPMISCVINQYEHMQPETNVAKTLKTAVLREFEKRFGKIEHVTLIAIATLLDPRFKNVHFNDAQAAARAISTLRKHMQEAEDLQTNSSHSSESETSDTNSDYDFWNHHKTLVHKPKKEKHGIAEIRDELSVYLSNPVSNLKSDPLETWKEMKLVFPNLYKQAIKYFSIVATSVPAERLFSKAGATVTQQRNRILGKRLSKLIFLNSISETDFFT